MARRLLFVLLLAVAMVSPVLSASEYNIADGQLLRVDSGASRLVIRTEQGARQYLFTPATRVTGAADDISHLTALSRVTVHYEQQSMTQVATVIEVHPL